MTKPNRSIVSMFIILLCIYGWAGAVARFHDAESTSFPESLLMMASAAVFLAVGAELLTASQQPPSAGRIRFLWGLLGTTAALACISFIVAGLVPNILWATLVGAAAGCVVRITNGKKA